jgi:hypothetical protein
VAHSDKFDENEGLGYLNAAREAEGHKVEK